jgi:hypothetical protein
MTFFDYSGEVLAGQGLLWYRFAFMNSAFSFSQAPSAVAAYAYAWRYWVTSEEASALA